VVLEGQYLERMALIAVGDPDAVLHLDGLYHRGDRRPPVVIAPPHPRQGGSMDVTVVAEAAWAITRAGHATLRFNYRGVGASQGEVGDAGTDREDLEAAIAHLAETTGQPRIALCGCAYGAVAALEVAAQGPRVPALALVVPPTREVDVASGVAALSRRPGGPPPVLVIAGDRDPACDVGALDALFAPLGDRIHVEVIPGADQSVSRGLPEVGRHLADFFSGRRFKDR
jgi:uncharacterized protein